MAEDREKDEGTTESTERIPPGSMPPDDKEPAEPADEKADRESEESFPASDPPSW